MHKAVRWLCGLIALLPLVLALPGAAAPLTHREYAPDLTNFPNPERGFYHQAAPLWLGSERVPQQLERLRMMRAEGISLLRWYFVIDEFRQHPIDAQTLAYLNQQLDLVRQAGLKVIPRFAYNFPRSGSYPYQEPDVPLEQALAHIDQLEPLLRAHSDIIAFMEAGFIGAWGEWHSSTHGLVTDTGRQLNEQSLALIERLLQALPPERMLALRYPAHRQFLFGAALLTPQQAFSGSPQARIGLHNDCFLASATDRGTFFADASARAAQRLYLHQENRFVPQGGETCGADAEAQPYIDCPNALGELAYFRFSTLNIDYQTDVLDRWREQGCMAHIERRLGYRLRLLTADIPAQAAPGDALTITLTLFNEGFASPYNPRRLELVLRAVDHPDRLYRFDLTAQHDPRTWLPDSGLITAPLTVTLPSSLRPGDYAVLLHLPDPAPGLYRRPEYAIRLANAGVWEAHTGFNDLGAVIAIS